MQKIFDFFYNIFIFIIIITTIYYILYKYIINTDAKYWINKFNNKWKNYIHSLYFRYNFNHNTNTIYTDYQLNNGLYLDLSQELNFPTI